MYDYILGCAVRRTNRKLRRYTLWKYARDKRKNPTKHEEFMWKMLRENVNRYNKAFFCRQIELFNKYIVDFYCPQLKIVIEVDGEYHKNETQKRIDKIRDAFLRKYGLIVSDLKILKLMQTH